MDYDIPEVFQMQLEFETVFSQYDQDTPNIFQLIQTYQNNYKRGQIKIEDLYSKLSIKQINQQQYLQNNLNINLYRLFNQNKKLYKKIAHFFRNVKYLIKEKYYSHKNVVYKTTIVVKH